MSEWTTFLGRLYERHQRAVWSYALALTSREDLAEDLVSEAFLGLARRMQTAGVPDKPLAYLFSSVRNGAIDESARRKTFPLDERHLRPAHSDEAELRDRQRWIADAIRSLDPPLSEAIALRIYAGMTVGEAASACGVPVSTFQSRYMLALEKLAFLLKETP